MVWIEFKRLGFGFQRPAVQNSKLLSDCIKFRRIHRPGERLAIYDNEIFVK
jgi:hypothetical protein